MVGYKAFRENLTNILKKVQVYRNMRGCILEVNPEILGGGGGVKYSVTKTPSLSQNIPTP